MRSEARPIGTCQKCGGTLYEYLAHLCGTAIVTSQQWGVSSSPRVRTHVCNCVGCCRVCGSCRTWVGHTPEFCALLVRQAAERAAMGHLSGTPTPDGVSQKVV